MSTDTEGTWTTLNGGTDPGENWTMVTISLLALAAVMFVCICVIACVLGRYLWPRLLLSKKQIGSKSPSSRARSAPFDLENQVPISRVDFSNQTLPVQDAGESFKNDLHLLKAQMDFVRVQYQPDESEPRDHSISRGSVASDPVSRPDSPFYMSSWASSPHSQPISINYVGSGTQSGQGTPRISAESPVSFQSSLPISATAEVLCSESSPVQTRRMVIRQLESAMASTGPTAIMELGTAIEDVLTVGGLSYDDDVVKEALGVLRGLMSSVPNPVVSPRQGGDL